MGDLEQFVQKPTETVQRIFEKRKQAGDSQEPREHLGASILGHHCSRFLWYSFRWCGKESFDGRMYRLFERGDIEEFRMVADLRAIGCEVHEINTETGEQFRVKFASGHGGGSLDGCALNIPEAPKTWHVIEFKTHSEKSFRNLQRKGVQEAKPKHYAQMQIYMHLTGMTRSLYLACNKNTDDLYSERVKYDKEFAESLISKGERIVTSTRPPLKAGADPGADECKWCAFTNLCHGNPIGTAVPCNVNCRTCLMAGPVMDGLGGWACTLKDKKLTKQDQIRGCPAHVFAPEIVTFSVMINVGKNDDGTPWVQYCNDKDGIWYNGSDRSKGQFNSKELTYAPTSIFTSGDFEVISSLKHKFEGEITDAVPNEEDNRA